MNDTVLYRGYDRAALDHQYDNRSRHPDHLEVFKQHDQDGLEALDAFKHRLDIPFGPSAEEVLDIYMPDDCAGAPVNVFLHGGYWSTRHKDDFRFISRGVVPKGGISVIVNYALVPSVDLDELIRQCRAAVAWTHGNIKDFGGDPDRIFVSGHSAGGHLTAMMMATDWPAFQSGLPADVVKGGCAISGVFDLTPIRHGHLAPTLGFTEDHVARLSPIALEPATAAPLIVAVGGDETDEFKRQGAEFAAAWRAHGIEVDEISVPGTHHFTVLVDAAKPATALGAAIAGQMGLG